jgi:hypothetical protein
VQDAVLSTRVTHLPFKFPVASECREYCCSWEQYEQQRR